MNLPNKSKRRSRGQCVSDKRISCLMLFYINFFIFTLIYFLLILNISYDNTVYLNYAWPHYQPWGAPGSNMRRGDTRWPLPRHF